jgi:hypothetical protein
MVEIRVVVDNDRVPDMNGIASDRFFSTQQVNLTNRRKRRELAGRGVGGVEKRRRSEKQQKRENQGHGGEPAREKTSRNQVRLKDSQGMTRHKASSSLLIGLPTAFFNQNTGAR